MPLDRRIDPARYSLDLFPHNPSCTLCPLHEGRRSVCIRTVRLKESLHPQPSTPALVCIGQNPGTQEDAAGYPFVGPSGHLLVEGCVAPTTIVGDSHPFDIFAPLCTIYFSNTVRCATPSGFNIPARCTKACFPTYTIPDLATISRLHHPSPLILLCVGAPAARAVFKHLFGWKKLPSQNDCFTLNGKSHTPSPTTLLTHTSITVFSCFHPAYVLRTPNAHEELSIHIGQVHAYLTGTTPTVTTPDISTPFSPTTP